MSSIVQTNRKERARDDASAVAAEPRVPAYERIADDIRARVRDGRLPAGTMLASRHNLAREYGVALSTAQQAIARLVADGILHTQDRRGTFVAHPALLVGNGETPTLAVGYSAGGGAAATPAVPAASIGTLGIVATSLIDQSRQPDIGSMWVRQAVRALEETFSASGGTTLFYDRFPAERGPYQIGIDDPQAVPMDEAIRALRERGADALAVVGLCDGRDVCDEIVAAVDVERVPVVYVSWHEVRPPLAHVFYDSRYAGYQAAQHLLRRGYGRLIFLQPFHEPWLAERIDGARDAVRHAGLPADTLLVPEFPDAPDHYDPDHAFEWTRTAAHAAFDRFNVFDSGGGGDRCGILAPNDFTAQAVLRAGSERGKTAGPDYGLIGFDDDPVSCAAGLTTVRPPIEAMGQEAGRLLLRALGGEPGGLQVRMRSQIIPRASTVAGAAASVSPARREIRGGHVSARSMAARRIP